MSATKVNSFKKDYVILTLDLTRDDNFSKCNEIPGFKKWEGRKLKVRINAANIRAIIRMWPDAEWEDDTNALMQVELERAQDEARILALRENALPLVDDDGYEYKRDPMDHQRRGFLLTRAEVAFAILCEQGTGKTKIIIDTANWLYNRKEIGCLIIIAWPNGVHRMWVDDEIDKDCNVPYKADFWSANLNKKKIASLDKAMQADRVGRLSIITFNVEAFASEAARDYMLRFLNRYKCMVVIDQSASIKNPSSKRTKFIIDEVSEHPNAIYRRIMDGDPVAEGAEELYAQFKFLNPDIIGHDTWTGFKSEFCIVGTRWNKFAIAGYRNMDRLKARIDPYCYRVLAKDCLDLPERVYRQWKFQLSNEERRIFDELKKKNLAFFEARDIEEEELEELPETGAIETSLAIVKNMRLQQVSSGWWPEKGNFRPIAKGEKEQSSRLQALSALLEAIGKGSKALIFARFRADLGALESLLGNLAVSYHGGISEADRANAKIQFMENPRVLYFLGQQRNAGIGHTLTAANHVIFYSNDHSLRLRAESEKRAHRKGLVGSLTIWDLCAENTQDRKLTDCLRHKRSVANEITKDPEQFFLDYEND